MKHQHAWRSRAATIYLTFAVAGKRIKRKYVFPVIEHDDG
jgi:hypothetical protein